jgi:hypothetical protein
MIKKLIRRTKMTAKACGILSFFKRETAGLKIYANEAATMTGMTIGLAKYKKAVAAAKAKKGKARVCKDKYLLDSFI